MIPRAEPPLTKAETTAAALRAGANLSATGYRGWDPYDALMSPLLARGPLRHARLLRRVFQQAGKRSPLNLRPLLRIRPGYNPVTLALALQAYADLSLATPSLRDQVEPAARYCLEEVGRLSQTGYSGACWGYDFDWETPNGTFPAHTPTVVATGMVTNALFRAYEVFGYEDAFELCRSACGFVANDLRRTEDEEGTFCWSYSPLDAETIPNATMKGARLCAQVYSVTSDDELRSLASATTRYVTMRQSDDGRWPYSFGDARKYADNYHTGYVLECLVEYGSRIPDGAAAAAAAAGWHYYRRHFIEDDSIPKYYDDRMYPIDATACAQTLVTLCAFEDLETAARVAGFSVNRLQQRDGAFAYQIHRRFTNRIPYARWSTAWMFAGLARTALALTGDR